ncbi:hypothetical protein CAP39_02000 [Sphingomonas sp. IBVSS1]|nr:hypothetical protein CAP39_02000 [Sphingomonas sp. IBVSS1]
MFSDADIARIGEGLINCTLPKPQWTHAAHVAAAAYILAARPDLDAEADMPGIIRRYNLATGGVNSDSAGYHHSITLASLAAVRAGLALAPDGPIGRRVNELLTGLLGDKYWPERFWTRELLFSVAARRGWVAPDKASLPFTVRAGMA